MITAKALGAMPDFAIAVLGERKTLRLLSDAGLAENLIRERLGYIPENALCEFVTGIGRALGEEHLGLLFSPYLTVEDYGAWGKFVLSAPDLGTALLRAQREMRLHSNTDRVEFVNQGNTISYAYEFGLKHHPSYPDMAYSAVAAMLSIPRSYLGQSWSPLRIEFDFPEECGSVQAEGTFGCPTLFDRPKLRLVFPKSVLTAPALKSDLAMPVTRSDIIRERLSPPANMLQSIRAVLDMQIADRDASLERLAHAIGIVSVVI
ncbi:AraC family transcriptional regulator ligand-binding domain-containing protein [Ruegeria halocynthiae]|uniref:AraC family transcriptional regulator ligand-binding domain-containing protein n=1 Tax=Ruegeria halocynthiae TaxID=985054 RepID=UPI000564703C|nr:AraC family transcriptional regulator ligand-binding domain-containing protein [Ruegeria halocynthiae]